MYNIDINNIINDIELSIGETKRMDCPNCGGKIRRYIDDPNDDSVARCEEAVKNKWKGRYADCYAQE